MRGGTAVRAGAAALALATCGLVSASGATQPTMTRPLVAIGYHVDYDPRSWETLVNYGRRLYAVITTSATVGEGGRIGGTHDARVITLSRERGTKVLFRLSNDASGSFSREIAHAVLTDPRVRRTVLDGIAAVVARHGYDGVNLDLENVDPRDRTALTAFMRELAARLHRGGKIVSIAVPPKSDDRPADNWSGAFDYAALGRTVDWLLVMAYDEHWGGSPPGPVASLPWVEAVLRYAADAAPSGRLVLGVAFYGYAWPGAGPGEGISMREALDRAARSRAAIRVDPRAGSPHFDADGRAVYFEDARSLQQKAALAARYGAAGIAAWRLGHEVPEVWSVLDPYLKRVPAGLTASRPSSTPAAQTPRGGTSR